MNKLISDQLELLIVGNDGGTNVGGSFLRAATGSGIRASLISMKEAMKAPALVRRFNWWVRGRRPTRLNSFSDYVVCKVEDERPRWLLTTGIAPLNHEALKRIGRLGVKRINFLTDDPWNPAHHAPWFLKALPNYDCVFSPRYGNLDDLIRSGCQKVQYLPFGFDPELFFPEPPETEEERSRFESDVMFAGGADDDRIPFFKVLAAGGINVSLYGDYWDRWPELKPFARGYADPKTLRKAIGGARVAICLVRRANRDGHSMRTYEVPAVGACMLVEDTHEHRDIFGEEMSSVAYFRHKDEMLEKLRWLLNNNSERERMADAAHWLVAQGGNTYKHRLLTVIGFDGSCAEL